jgi:hypothetical protein
MLYIHTLVVNQMPSNDMELVSLRPWNSDARPAWDNESPRDSCSGTDLTRATATAGALVSLCAPFISCYVGFGDAIDVSSSCVQEGTNRLACFENNSASLSCILTTTVGGAIFAAGICTFYSAYARSVTCFVRQTNACKYARHGMILLLAIECIGMLMCSLIPIITFTASILHGIGFFTWILAGFLLAATTAIVATSNSHVPYTNGMYELITYRLVLSSMLLVLCIASFAFQEETGPLFRSSEYVFLLCQMATGVAFVFIETKNRLI